MSKYVIAFVVLGLCTVPASAQVTILVNDAKTAVIYKVNEPDTLGLAKEQAARLGGTWRTLFSEDMTCGGGALWYASNGATRRYFHVNGRATVAEANAEAAKKARAFAASNLGWTAGSLRTYYNKNAYIPTAGPREKMVERTVGRDRCTHQFLKNTTTGVRG